MIRASAFQTARRALSHAAGGHPSTYAINKVTVVGSGLMGTGIAQVAAAAGCKVTLLDANADALAKGVQRIQDSVARVAKKKHADEPKAAEAMIHGTMDNISTSTTHDTVAHTDLVVEAITENLEAKKKLFAAVDAIAPAHTIFATNTSSLSVAKIAAATKRLDRFGGLHFFNPVPVMKLLEVVRLPETSPATVAALTAFGQRVGKHVVSCKDTPGFVVNRLLVPYLMEAARMVERGDATPEDVDMAMKLGAGHPMGPIALLDYVGLDTCHFIAEGWARDFPNEPLFRPVPSIAQLVADKKFGVKSGQGFYKYTK